MIHNFELHILLYKIYKNILYFIMHLIGFEPTPPKRIELESIALDHSATNAINNNIFIYKYTLYICDICVLVIHNLLVSQYFNI